MAFRHGGLVWATAFILLVGASICLAGCAKTSDRAAYEDVVSSMSVEKAKRFFAEYPNSVYRDRLAEDIVEWCRQDPTDEVLLAAIEALPKDHPRRNDVAAIIASRPKIER